MRRYAVDKSAEDYWSEYFGEYGQAWVRNIPRRVSAALQAKDTRLASADIQPLGVALRADGGLTLEGFAAARRKSASSGARHVTAFSIDFDAAGRVVQTTVREA